jgi:hypothetical protein
VIASDAERLADFDDVQVVLDRPDVARQRWDC